MSAKTTHEEARDGDLNADPITGEPGAHPVGTGVGASAGGATGAAIGSLGGPIGTAVGAVIGAVIGGLVGKGVAEMIDPTAEDAHWRESHWSQPHADKTRPYEAYAPAYRTGYAGYREGKSFDDREADLRMEYEGGPQKAEAESAPATGDPGRASGSGGNHPLRWEDAREAARAAYDRVRRGEARRVEEARD